MVNIECTRCGASGTDFPTFYVAKFSLQHNTGCGAKIGIPKYSEGKPTLKDVEPVIQTAPKDEKLFSDVTKPKKKKASKKTDHSAQ